VAYVLAIGAVDAVSVVVSHAHPFGKRSSPFEQRLALARLAFAEFARVEVSDVEASLPPPSYTLHTLEALGRLHPRDELRLMIGADVLAECSGWYRWADVARLAPPLVLGRQGYEGPPGLVKVLPEVSSTQVRALLERQDAAAREELAALVPRAVLKELERHRAALTPGGGA
jgi:nicotinate-nucleotide adenylyltransferase